MFENIYRDKTVLVTGHTGFKGTWLCAWLTKLGANVHGVSLPGKAHKISHFDAIQDHLAITDHRFDICKREALLELLAKVQPHFIFHLAGQAIVNHSYDYPLSTIMTNAIGSANILDCATTMTQPCQIIMITSDKVYRNNEWSWGYREIDELGDNDPYSASKAMAELAIRAYTSSFFKHSNNSKININTARAGNVIGGGDWSVDRLVPDCVEAWARNKSVEIRAPASTRPWQHVLEPLSGYLTLGMHMARDGLSGEAFNFGPREDSNYSVELLIAEMQKYWTSVLWSHKPPKDQLKKEATLLKLNCDKALHILDWKPTFSFNDTVKLTALWYKSYYEGTSNILNLTNDQIDQFTATALAKNISWTN